jgi:hypothetical protein
LPEPVTPDAIATMSVSVIAAACALMRLEMIVAQVMMAAVVLRLWFINMFTGLRF